MDIEHRVDGSTYADSRLRIRTPNDADEFLKIVRPGGETVFTMTADGHLKIGAGVHPDDAAAEFRDALVRLWDHGRGDPIIKASMEYQRDESMAENVRLRAKIATLEDLVEDLNQELTGDDL